MMKSASEVAAGEGISPLEQARNLIPLALRGVPPKEAYLHRLYVPTRAVHADRYVWQGWNVEVLRRLDPGHRDVWPKLEFHRDCRQHGLPDVPVIAAIIGHRIVVVDGPAPDAIGAGVWNGDLIVKPDLRAMGNGVMRWSRGPEALLAYLSADRPPHSREHRWLVQAPLVAHPALLPIAGRALGTLRLMTYRAPDGNIAIALPTLRITVGSGVVDHVRHGNLAAPVDPDSGRLGVARGYSPRHVVREYSHHPDTGAPIIGREVPLWREAFALAQRAHACFPHLFAVGWDVALTPDGVRLVEGNSVFGVEMIQIAWDTPLGDTAYVEALAYALARVGVPASP